MTSHVGLDRSRLALMAGLSDPQTGELMSKAVTVFPCGHTFGEQTIADLALPKHCPLDRQRIKRDAPNLAIRALVSTCVPKEAYSDLLVRLLDMASVKQDPMLVGQLERKARELAEQDSGVLTLQQIEDYNWAQKLLRDHKVSQASGPIIVSSKQRSNTSSHQLTLVGTAGQQSAAVIGGAVEWRRSTSDEESPDESTQSSLSRSVRKENKTEIAEKYYLICKINREEVRALLEQTGIKITIPEGANKTKALIGAGRFGRLRLAQAVEDQKFVAVKKIKGADEIAASEQEGKIQKALSGLDNVMPLLDSVSTVGSKGEPVLYQFMPLAGFGNGVTLREILSKQSDFSVKRKLLGHVAHGVLTALGQMHTFEIAHLDLKNSNIVFSQTGEVYVIDFGCAMQAQNLAMLVGGNGDSTYFSPGRIAYCRYALRDQLALRPELLTQKHFSGIAADFWALGVMLLELMNNNYPFQERELMQKLMRWDASCVDKQLESALSNVSYNPLIDLIKHLLSADKDPKVTATQLLAHPLFDNKDYRFSSDNERTQTFQSLKTVAANTQVPKVAGRKKSEDKLYIQTHYPKQSPQPASSGEPHTYLKS